VLVWLVVLLLLCPGVRPFQGAALAAPRLQAPKQHLQICEAASLQFIKGVNEATVPDVSLRRSRTGTSGQAMFTFENPTIFQASSELGDITGRLSPGQLVGQTMAQRNCITHRSGVCAGATWDTWWGCARLANSGAAGHAVLCGWSAFSF
jgi:hypothetical protein